MYFEKQPREETTISITTSGWREIQRGETLISATVTVTQDNIPVTGIYISHAIEGSTIFVRLMGGIAGLVYKITLLCITNVGHVREVDVAMNVVEK